MAEETEYRLCDCTHCEGEIEFPARGEGESIVCPHCGEITLLHSPSTLGYSPNSASASGSTDRADPVFTPRRGDQTAYKIHVVTYHGGLEQRLSFWAKLLAGSAGFFGLAGIVFGTLKFGRDDLVGLVGVAAGTAFVIGGIFVFVFLHACAEVIRLLKYSSDLNFNGDLSEVLEEHTYQCSECSTEVHSDSEECSACNRSFARMTE